MEKLETIILTETWSDLLGAINKTSLSLQNNTITMDVATKLLASLSEYIDNARNNFDQYESAAKEINPNSDYKNKLQKKIIRSTRITFLENPPENVQLEGKEKLYVETFLPIIDNLHAKYTFKATIRIVQSNT
jgi:hypothetical protein